jgi:competence protein ComEA
VDVVAGFSLTRQQALVLGAALLFLLALGGKRLAAAGASEGPRSAAPLLASTQGVASARAGPRLVVHVVGAVRRAGLYRLRDGSRVADAIARAGGATRRADLGLLNLAAPLADGQQVLVPRRGVAAASADSAAGGTSPPGAKVSLATATVEQLDSLPGIGPVTAQQIVEWRTANGPFRSVDDLDEVPGIGPTRIEQLREAVTP